MLLMVYQFQYLKTANLSKKLLKISDIFGISLIIEKWQIKLNTIFSQIIRQGLNFSIKNINAIIKKN